VTLLLSTAAYEVAGNRIMVVTSDFYVAITGRDTSLYLHTLWLSLLIVLAVVVCKVRWGTRTGQTRRAPCGQRDLPPSLPPSLPQTFKTLSVELLALQCRRCLQRHFHDLYFIPPSFPASTPPCAIAHVLDEDKGGEEAGKEGSGQRGARRRHEGREGGGGREGGRGAYAVLYPALPAQTAPTLPGTSSETSLPPSLPPSAPVDNPDQRLTSDLEIFGAKLAELIGQTLAVPALVLYCE